MLIENVQVRDIAGGRLDFSAGDKFRTELPSKVLLKDMIFEDNKVEFSSLLRIYENSILTVRDSVF